MHILILGGTSFLGNALCAEALSRNHRVTLFNRGTKPAPMGTTSYVGDRKVSTSLDILDGQTFDAVIDTWGREPAPAIRSMEKLKDRTSHWTYVSTISVYDQSPAVLGDGSRLNDETTKLCEVVGPNCTKSVTSFNKRAVEVAAESILHDIPTVIARLCVMAGPREASYIERCRLPWWLDRIRRGGQVLAPGPQDLKMQLIDVRDAARFIIDGAEEKRSGPYNICGNHGDITFGQLLKTANQLTGNNADFIWATSEEIAKLQLRPFTDLPLWLPLENHEYQTVYTWDNVKALKAGLKLRPLSETIRDTWLWMTSKKGPVHAPRGVDLKLWRTLGLFPEREVAALQKLESIRRRGNTSPPPAHILPVPRPVTDGNGYLERHPEEVKFEESMKRDNV